MALDNRLRSLIAVGASVSANCQPCLVRTLELALGEGADGPQIAEAIEIGRRVRRGAGSKTDEFADSLLGRSPGSAAAGDEGCVCAPQASPPD